MKLTNQMLGAFSISMIWICLSSCGLLSDRTRDSSLFDDRQSLLTIGRDFPPDKEVYSKNEAPYLFRNILEYAVSQDGYVIIYDPRSLEIRLFDSNNAAFLHTIGKVGRKPDEHMWVSDISFSPNDDIFILTGGEIKQYRITGEYVRTVPVPPSVSNHGHLTHLKITHGNNFVLVTVGADLSQKVWIMSLLSADATPIHESRERITLTEAVGILRFWPLVFGVDLDESILVADQVEYKVSVYDSHGHLFKKIQKPFEAPFIAEKDLHLKIGDKLTIPLSVDRLQGPLRRFPSVTGISVTTDGRKLVWTSQRQKDFTFRVDIYDGHWNLLASDYKLALITKNLYTFSKGRVYVPDMGFGTFHFIRNLSMYDLPKLPTTLAVFAEKRGQQ